MTVIYANGEFIAADAAPVGAAAGMTAGMVAASDGGLLRGEGLFETLRAYDGRAFQPQLHGERLRHSAAALGLALPAGRLDLPGIASRLLQENKLREARLRLTLTGGGACLATAEPFAGYPGELYEHGAAVTMSRSRLDEHSRVAGHKVTSCFGNMLELRAARERGFVDALRVNFAGHLAEGCVSNVFLVIGGELHTPSLACGCLGGIARRTVLELARGAGIECHERQVEMSELTDADELFLTNSLMELMPVVRVDDATIGSGRPGEMTLRILGLYRQLVKEQC